MTIELMRRPRLSCGHPLRDAGVASYARQCAWCQAEGRTSFENEINRLRDFLAEVVPQAGGAGRRSAPLDEGPVDQVIRLLG
jgi:hypothetical protein